MKKISKILLLGIAVILCGSVFHFDLQAKEEESEWISDSSQVEKELEETIEHEKEEASQEIKEELEEITNTVEEKESFIQEEVQEIHQEQVKQNETLYQEYLIPDLQFRKMVNRKLRKSGAELETYSATQEDLDSITMLDIESTSNLGQEYIELQSLKGIELLHNLEILQIYEIIAPESILTEISLNTNITRFTMNSVVFKGDNASLTTVLMNTSINGGAVQEKIEVPLDNHVDLTPVGKLVNLTYIEFSMLGTQQNSGYSFLPRTHFIVSGLGTLANVKYFHFGQMASVDDPTFSFVEKLTKLDDLKLVEVPLNTVEFISPLPNLTRLNINGTSVKDFRPIIDKDYFSRVYALKLSHDTLYTKTVEENGTSRSQLILETGVNPGADIKSISFSTVQGFQGTFGIEDYKVVDGKIVIDMTVLQRKSFAMFNWQTGKNDIQKFGTVYGFDVTLENGKSIAYSVIPINIGKTVTFDLNYEGGASYPVEFDVFESIVPLDEKLTKREGYKFLGWYLEPECLTAFDFTTEVNENMTLYAKWEKATMYTVIYTDGVANEEIFPDQIMTVQEGETTPQFIGVPERTGYKFLGWSPEIAATVNGDAVYEAMWEKEDVIEEETSTTPPVVSETPSTGAKQEIVSRMAFMIFSICAIIVASNYRKKERNSSEK